MSDPLLQAAELFGALAHPARVHVLALLLENEPRTAGDLADATGLERTALSHQLRVLKAARLIADDRVGRHRHYRLLDQHVAHIVADALLHVREC